MLLLHLLFIYLFIYLLVDLLLLWPRGSCVASGKQSTIPSSFTSAGPLNPVHFLGRTTERSCTTWSGVVSSCGEDTCFVSSDKTLYFSVSAFLLDSDCEKQMQSGPLDICTTAIQINKDKRNTAKLCYLGTLSLKVTQVSVCGYCWRRFPSFPITTHPVPMAGLTRMNAFSCWINVILKHGWQRCVVSSKCATDAKFIKNKNFFF